MLGTASTHRKGRVNIHHLAIKGAALQDWDAGAVQLHCLDDWRDGGPAALASPHSPGALAVDFGQAGNGLRRTVPRLNRLPTAEILAGLVSRLPRRLFLRHGGRLPLILIQAPVGDGKDPSFTFLAPGGRSNRTR